MFVSIHTVLVAAAFAVAVVEAGPCNPKRSSSTLSSTTAESSLSTADISSVSLVSTDAATTSSDEVVTSAVDAESTMVISASVTETSSVTELKSTMTALEPTTTTFEFTSTADSTTTATTATGSCQARVHRCAAKNPAPPNVICNNGGPSHYKMPTMTDIWTWEECAAMCDENPQCVAFHFDASVTPRKCRVTTEVYAWSAAGSLPDSKWFLPQCFECQPLPGPEVPFAGCRLKQTPPKGAVCDQVGAYSPTAKKTQAFGLRTLENCAIRCAVDKCDVFSLQPNRYFPANPVCEIVHGGARDFQAGQGTFKYYNPECWDCNIPTPFPPPYGETSCS